MIKRFFRLILFCVIMLLLMPIASIATFIEGTIFIPLWYVFLGNGIIWIIQVLFRSYVNGHINL